LAQLVGNLSANQCSGRLSGPPANTLEQVQTGVGGQGDAGVPEPLRDHHKAHVGGDVDFSNAEFSKSTIDFARPRHWNPGPTVDWTDTDRVATHRRPLPIATLPYRGREVLSVDEMTPLFYTQACGELTLTLRDLLVFLHNTPR
jgi:hypothetical protein